MKILKNVFKKSADKSKTSVNQDKKAVEELLTRGVDEVIVLDHLKKRLLSGEKLRIKFGIDPTSPNIHLGHTVPLRKLRQFQDMGHQAVLIIGDATAMIGDPTGRSGTRDKLSRSQIDEYKKDYLEQAGKVLDLDSLEVRHNGEWFNGMSAAQFLELSSLVSINQLLQRKDFRARIEDEENPLSALEATYPMMQGYDSVMVEADLELGGVDQKLNLLMGRQLQRRFEQQEQDVMTVPLLVGTDGEKKMSKSFGNAIPLRAEPNDMFGKLMSVPDALIFEYFTLLTPVDLETVMQFKKDLDAGANPRDIKLELAKVITSMYHGEVAAEEARAVFISTFSKGALPDDIPTLKSSTSMSIIDVLLQSDMCKTKSDARRQIDGGGVKLDGVVVVKYDSIVDFGQLVQKGKRFFVRLEK